MLKNTPGTILLDKTSWGGSTVDYKVIAGKAVAGMSAQEVQHFLVVCSLVSDLYCPGYNPRQSLGKDSNLARTTARYKIDSAEVSAEVRAELSKKKDKEKSGENAPKATPSVKRK